MLITVLKLSHMSQIFTYTINGKSDGFNPIAHLVGRPLQTLGQFAVEFNGFFNAVIAKVNRVLAIAHPDDMLIIMSNFLHSLIINYTIFFTFYLASIWVTGC